MTSTKKYIDSPDPHARYCAPTSCPSKAVHKTMHNSLMSNAMLRLLDRATLATLPEEVLEMIVDKLYSKGGWSDFVDIKVHSDQVLHLGMTERHVKFGLSASASHGRAG